MAANYTDPTNYNDPLHDDYMVGPTSQFRIKTQTCLLSFLLIFSIIDNGVMLILFARFKSLRRLSNYILIDLTIVEFLDIIVNVPIFMEFFLLTKKKNLERQTRWYAMLFHRYFLLNDLFSQILQTIDCFLAIKYGKRYTSKKTSSNVKAVIAFKWVIIMLMLLVFMIPTYTFEDEYVSDEAYQRLLFGPNQVIWKIVIPSCQTFAVVLILLTNRLIIKSRKLVSKRYGMRTHGKGSKNSSKAVNTLTLIMVVQTLCKVPAAAYSYVAVDDRVEGNRWFAFFSYFFLFLSSSLMPLIYFRRTMAFRRALHQIRKHPFARNAYLDYAAQHGLKSHRNGRLHLDPKIMRRNEKASPKPKGGYFSGGEHTKETDLSSRTTTQNSRPLSLATEASILELPMSLSLGDSLLELDFTDTQLKCKSRRFSSNELEGGTEQERKKYLKFQDTRPLEALKVEGIKIIPSYPSTTSAIDGVDFAIKGLQPWEDQSCSNEVEVSANEKIKEYEAFASEGTNLDELIVNSEKSLVDASQSSILDISGTRYALDKTAVLKPEINEKVLLSNEEEEVQLETWEVKTSREGDEFPCQKVELPSQKVSQCSKEAQIPRGEQDAQLPNQKVEPQREEHPFLNQKVDQLPSQKVQPQDVQLPREEQDSQLATQKVKLQREEDIFPNQKVDQLPSQKVQPQDVQLTREEQDAQLPNQKVEPQREEDKFPNQKVDQLPSQKVQPQDVQLTRGEQDAQLPNQKVEPQREEDPFPSQRVQPQDVQLPREEQDSQLATQKVKLQREEDIFPNQKVDQLPSQKVQPQDVQLPREEQDAQLASQKVEPQREEDKFPNQKVDQLPSQKVQPQDVQLTREEQDAQLPNQKVKLQREEDPFLNQKVDQLPKQKVISKEVELSSQGVVQPTEEGNSTSESVKAREKYFAEIEVKAMVHWDCFKAHVKEVTNEEEDDFSFNTKL